MQENVKNELEAIRASAASILEKVEVLLDVGEKDNSDEGVSSWWVRRNSVLAEVIKKGGNVTSEEWVSIGKKYGIDARGLGGFFVGNSSMVKIGMNRRAITEKGLGEVRHWLMEYPEMAEKFGLDPDNLT